MIEPRIKVFLIVEVDDEQVYAGEWLSLESMEEDLRKPQRAIDEYLQKGLIDLEEDDD